MRRTVAVAIFLLAVCEWSHTVSDALAARAIGIDVSHYQGTITPANWTSIFNSGRTFAWTKADESTINADNDSTFVNNMINGRAAGLYMGAYHFARPESNSDATVEAQHFLSVVQPNGPSGSNNFLAPGYFRPMLDIETDGSAANKTYLSNWINTFCDYIVAHGGGARVEPLVYMNSNYANNYVNSSVATRDLDVADYLSGANPPPPTGSPPAGIGVWSTWSFWQYNSSGSVPGISGNVDMDIANGDVNFMKQFVISGATEQFDVNGTTAGSGITNNGSYTWEGTKFSSSSDGIDPVAWVEGNFVRFAAGTDAGTSNYTVTANSNHTFAGMILQGAGIQPTGGGTVTVNGPGMLSIASGDQNFYVDISSQNLKINAVLAGTGRLVWQGNSGAGTGAGGSLYLLGNNTYTGGTLINTSAGLNFNNDHSFGTGRITWNHSQVVFANDLATAPVTIANPVTALGGAQMVYVGPAVAPVTFSGTWTIPSGIVRLSVGNTTHTSSQMTISGVMGGSGAITKDGVGTLVLSGGNTYTGATLINGGTLDVSGASARLGTGNVTVQNTTSTVTVLSIETGVANAISDSATLTLAGGGAAGVADQSYANLAAGINETVNALVLGGAAQSSGKTYGSSSSGAMIRNDEFFSGSGMITVGLLGDYNDDSRVDSADYIYWQRNDGSQVGYDTWRANFGNSAPGSGSSLLGQTAVPEPNSLAAAWITGAAVILLRRRWAHRYLSVTVCPLRR